ARSAGIPNRSSRRPRRERRSWSCPPGPCARRDASCSPTARRPSLCRPPSSWRTLPGKFLPCARLMAVGGRGEGKRGKKAEGRKQKAERRNETRLSAFCLLPSAFFFLLRSERPRRPRTRERPGLRGRLHRRTARLEARGSRPPRRAPGDRKGDGSRRRLDPE